MKEAGCKFRYFATNYCMNKKWIYEEMVFSLQVFIADEMLVFWARRQVILRRCKSWNIWFFKFTFSWNLKLQGRFFKTPSIMATLTQRISNVKNKRVHFQKKNSIFNGNKPSAFFLYEINLSWIVFMISTMLCSICLVRRIPLKFNSKSFFLTLRFFFWKYPVYIVRNIPKNFPVDKYF